MSTNTRLDEIKRIDLISFLKGMGFKPAWQRGDRAMFHSPLREDRNPSFYVYLGEEGSWFWKDWGTGRSGDIINFVQEYHGLTFGQAVEMIGGASVEKPAGFSKDPSAFRGRSVNTDSVQWVKKVYKKGLRMNASKMETVRRYFWGQGVKYHPEMGCILVKDRVEGKEFVGIPIPFPLKIQGLELREIGGPGRKTWGRKMLWLLKREFRRMLVTESILDALAGEVLLGDEGMTLCSLNGVTNVAQLEVLFLQHRPAEVILALDGDEPGRMATLEAIEIARRHSVHVTEWTGHLEAGVKDLHKLLMKREEKRDGSENQCCYERKNLFMVSGAFAFS